MSYEHELFRLERSFRLWELSLNSSLGRRNAGELEVLFALAGNYLLNPFPATGSTSHLLSLQLFIGLSQCPTGQTWLGLPLARPLCPPALLRLSNYEDCACTMTESIQHGMLMLNTRSLRPSTRP